MVRAQRRREARARGDAETSAMSDTSVSARLKRVLASDADNSSALRETVDRLRHGGDCVASRSASGGLSLRLRLPRHGPEDTAPAAPTAPAPARIAGLAFMMPPSSASTDRPAPIFLLFLCALFQNVSTPDP